MNGAVKMLSTNNVKIMGVKKNLKVGIIMHAYANDTKTRQKIGRFLRLSPEETAIIHILCYENTIDLHWVKSELSTFKQHNIKIYKRYRFPPEIIQYAVWLYFRINLSQREIEDLLAKLELVSLR